MLSFRLKTLRDYYRGEESIWDIGCDHGQLGLSFTEEKKVKFIDLVDPSGPVISVLKQSIDSYITIPDLKLSLHHMKGQEVQLSSQNKLIFIAGMGGKEIQEILTHLIPQLKEADRVVISPHRKILELRQFLSQSPLNLEEEISIEEGNQFYQILCLTLYSKYSKASLFGEAVWKGEVGEKYRKQQIAAYKTHQDKASLEYLRFLEGTYSRN